MATLPYEIVDVFTDRPFAGNSLAVVLDADGLTTEQMQSLATEFNLSETVFVLPPTTDAATYRLRIFTPRRELPFAGHPSVGAAVVQLRRGMIDPGHTVQECGAGLLPVLLEERGTARITGGAPRLGSAVDAGPLLTGLGLAVADLVGPAPRSAGCGLDYVYALVGRDAVARATAPREGHVALFSWDEASRSAHARVFAADYGVAEDPATGSAALGLGVYLVSIGALPGDGTVGYTVHQGHELGRPSLLDCMVTALDGSAVGATVAGQVVGIASGAILVPPA